MRPYSCLRQAELFRELWRKYRRAKGPGAAWHARDFRRAMRLHALDWRAAHRQEQSARAAFIL